MSCGEMLEYQETMFLAIMLDYLIGIVTVVTVISIMIYFLGVDGKITGKSMLPLTVFFVYVITSAQLLMIYIYLTLGKDKNALFTDETLAFSLLDIPNVLNRLLYYTAIFLTGMLTFKKKRVKDSILAVVFTIVLSAYLILESMVSIYFFFDSPTRILSLFSLKDYFESKLGIINEVITLSILLIFFIAVYFGMIRKDRKIYVKWKYRLIFIVWEVMMAVLLFIPFIVSESVYEGILRHEIGMILPVMGLVVPFIFIAIISRRYMVEKTVVQENYILAELDYLNQYKKDQSETRAFRREIKSKLEDLSVMYSGKDYSRAEKSLSSLLGNVKAMSPRFITGDDMLDCIIGMKSSKMDEEGIEFIMDGVIDGGLGMKPVDTCCIFANALDNAIEACEKLPKDVKRWIKMEMKKTDKFFSITLSNSMQQNEESGIISKIFGSGERVTTKTERAYHGYGTQNMRAAISKYDGIEKVSSKEGVFTLSIIFPRSV